MSFLDHHTSRGAAILALVLATTGTLSAQAPRTVTYQGVLAEPSGSFISDGSHTLTLTLYDAPVGGSSVWTESQALTTVRGLFNASLGAATPIPSTLAFDRAYWLGVSVDGGTELTPRTALSAVPYALHAQTAEVAKSLAPGATGVVTSINGGEGAITITGGGATTVNRTGNTITISSSGGSGGSGIQGIQSSDAAIAIGNGSGPIASLALIDGGIGGNKLATDAVTTDKIANGTVTPAKINSAGAASGSVLTFNGTNVAWAPAASGLTLPYANSTTSNSDAFSITSTGTGRAGSFINGNAAPARSSLYGEVNATSSTTLVAGVEGRSRGSMGMGVLGISGGTTTPGIYGAVLTSGTTSGVYGPGSGVSGFSEVGSGVVGTTYSNTSYGVLGSAVSNGIGVKGSTTTGKAGYFVINSATNGNTTLEATTGGTGRAGLFTITNATSVDTAFVAATAGMGGGAGRFELTSSSNTGAALSGISRSTAGVGYGVYGSIPSTSSDGSNAGAAVRGAVTGSGSVNMGVYGSHGGSGTGVLGSSVGGAGVMAMSTAPSGVGTALEVRNGAIKVSGTNVPAFTHTSAAANISINSTTISNPMCDGDPNAILIVTQGGSVYNAHPIGVTYNSTTSKWMIYNEDIAVMPTNKVFNILVIKR